MQKQKGFTLVELLIYMGLLSILVGILSTIFVSIIDVQLNSRATSNVEQDGRFILARLTHDIQSASSIVSPNAAGGSGNSLQIHVDSTNYTYSLNNGNLQVTSGSEVNNLNGVNTRVSGLTFLRVGDGDNDDTVRINFTVSSTTSGPNTESRSYQTTLGLP